MRGPAPAACRKSRERRVGRPTVCWGAACSGALLACSLRGEGALDFTLSHASCAKLQCFRLGRRPWRAVLARVSGSGEREVEEEDELGQAEEGVSPMERLGRRVPVEDLEPGQELKGIVQSVRPWGCFVDVGAEREGLLHISRIRTKFVDKIFDILQAGQEIVVRVEKVSDDGKLSLRWPWSPAEVAGGRPPQPRMGLRPVDAAPVRARRRRGPRKDLSDFKGIPNDRWLRGTVKSIHSYGAFVEVASSPGGSTWEGLVHKVNLREGFTSHPADVVHTGQEVQVRVLHVNLFAKDLTLSMKDPAAASDIQVRFQDVTAFNQVLPTEWLTGLVYRVAKFGVIVDVEPPGGGAPVQGLVHATELEKDFADEFKEGQELRVRAIRVDPYVGRLILSVNELPRNELSGPVG